MSTRWIARAGRHVPLAPVASLRPGDRAWIGGRLREIEVVKTNRRTVDLELRCPETGARSEARLPLRHHVPKE